MSTSKGADRLSQDLSSSLAQPWQPDAATDCPPEPLSLSPTATLGHPSPRLPALPDLPPCSGREPSASAEHIGGASDTAYYTASWGSPYQNPPPRSINSHLAAISGESPSASSEPDDGSSPNLKFGLSHLLPSRLPKVSRIAPSRPSTPTAEEPEAPSSPSRFPYLASLANQTRSFFATPTRPGPVVERDKTAVRRDSRGGPNNKAEGSHDHELVSSPPHTSLRSGSSNNRSFEAFQLDGTADTGARTERLRQKGHRSRDENLTLTQEDFNFWPTKRIVTPNFDPQEAIERSRMMYASRYADPEAGSPPQPPPKDRIETDDESRTPQAKFPATPKRVKTPSSQLLMTSTQSQSTPATPMQRKGSASGRIRRTVRYKGKNVHINIPRNHGDLVPMTKSEVAAKIKKFEDDGYDTSGFSNWTEMESGPSHMYAQNRDVFPDPSEDIDAQRRRAFQVRVPNKQLWDDYVTRLREEKLRALGVLSSVASETIDSPMSRQASTSQFSTSLPFSPPLPTSSASSQRHAYRGSVFQTSFGPTSSGPGPTSAGHAPALSMAMSPVSATGQIGTLHAHRPSMFLTPNIHQIMTPPGLNSFPAQLAQTLAQVGGSPGPELGDINPLPSPFGGQQGGQDFPFDQRNELLAQMQRQKDQQAALHMQQHASMQQILNSARPTPVLQELPELVENERELPRPLMRSRQGEGPEIVNPKPSHRHNASIKLQQDIESSEYHLEELINKQMDEEDSDGFQMRQPQGQHTQRTTSLRPANELLLAEDSASTSLPNVGQRLQLRQEPAVSSLPPEHPSPWIHDSTFKPRPQSPSRPIQQLHRASKPSVSGLNVAAKEFNPSGFAGSKPGAVFDPTSFSPSAFSFALTSRSDLNHAGGASTSPPSRYRQPPKSTFGLSPAAPAFNPQASSFQPSGFRGFGSSIEQTFAPAKVDFQFSSGGPSFKPTAPVFTPLAAVESVENPTFNLSPQQAGSIFGNIRIADDGKRQQKKTRALPVVYPEAYLSSDTARESFVEGADGRLGQSEDRIKRSRRLGGDGDKMPLFALPDEQLNKMGSRSPTIELEYKKAAMDVARGRAIDAGLRQTSECSEAEPLSPSVNQKPALQQSSEPDASPAWPSSSAGDEQADKDIASSTQAVQSGTTSRIFSKASTLSDETAPTAAHPSFVIDEGLKNAMTSRLRSSEAKSPDTAEDPQTSSPSPVKTARDEPSEDDDNHGAERERLPSSVRYFDDEADQLSFNEIDQVMQHINEQGSDGGVERDASSWPDSSPRGVASPLLSSPQPHQLNAPIWNNAPSPSSGRPKITKTLNVEDESDSADQDPFSDGRAVPNYESPARRVDDANDIPLSDWDDVISSGQEEQFKQKAQFFGPGVSDAIKSAMENHFASMEKRFNILVAEQAERTQPSSRRARSRVTVDSDADDEDDDAETDAYSRGFSPKRDRRMEKFKIMLQEALAAHKAYTPPTQDHSSFEALQQAIAEIQVSAVPRDLAKSWPTVDEMKAMIEECVAQQNEALLIRREEAVKAEAEERFTEIADRLREAASRIAAETEARSEAERREAETSRLLRITEEELNLLKVIERDNTEKVRHLEEAAQQAKFSESRDENSSGAMSKKLSDLASENEQLKDTLEEYRLSSDKWRRDIDEASFEREKTHSAFGALKIQAEEALRIRETMRSRIEKLQDEMSTVVSQVAAERAQWNKTDAEHRTRYEILAARAEAEARTRERFERELERLEAQEKTSYQLKAALEHERAENVKLDGECERLSSQLKEMHSLKLELVQTQKENTRLEDLVEQNRAERTELQNAADNYAREFREAREAGILEVQRTRHAFETEIEFANNQVNIVRAELETENSRLRTELDNARLDADHLRAKHEIDLEQAADARHDALGEQNELKETIIAELRATFEERLEGLAKQHRRDLDHTIENKNQAESFLRDAHAQQLQDLQDHHERTLEQALNEKEFIESQLNERLGLADSKIQLLQDKLLHLEEKLEMAKEAAHAAAIAAQSSQSPKTADTAAAPETSASRMRGPEKISPQALRESIAVLQEQLQEREQRIEGLEQELSEVDKDAPSKIKAKETEITWLRELIGVRVDDISDLINVLARPDFDREAVRNAAIRIRASIQMEQDAKERQIHGSPSFPTLTSISNFASPRAAQLAAAIGSWRKGGGGLAPSALSQSSPSGSSIRTETPSRPMASSQVFLNGLMTPPTSNLRKTPSPDTHVGASRPRPLNHQTSGPRPLGVPRPLGKRPSSRDSEDTDQPSTPPLLKEVDYDDDAEESVTGFYDDEASTVDHGTPRAERIRRLDDYAAELER